jgi:hypothetical protein
MKFKYDELKQVLENSKGFMITITTRNDSNMLNHHLFTENFLRDDMLPSFAEAERLVIARLKEPRKPEAPVIEDAVIVEAEHVKDSQ